MEKKRLFSDMDGTLTVFNPVDTLEKLYEKGYFLNLEPQKNVIGAIRIILQERKDIEVYILSAVLMDSKHAIKEKNQWLDAMLPEIDQEHRIFLSDGEDKKDYVPGGVKNTDWLLDDYTKNLLLWGSAGKGIKLLNGINHTEGTWPGDAVCWNKGDSQLALNITNIIDGNLLDLDKSIPQLKPEQAMKLKAALLRDDADSIIGERKK